MCRDCFQLFTGSKSSYVYRTLQRRAVQEDRDMLVLASSSLQHGLTSRSPANKTNKEIVEAVSSFCRSGCFCEDVDEGVVYFSHHVNSWRKIYSAFLQYLQQWKPNCHDGDHDGDGGSLATLSQQCSLDTCLDEVTCKGGETGDDAESRGTIRHLEEASFSEPSSSPALVQQSTNVSPTTPRIINTLLTPLAIPSSPPPHRHRVGQKKDHGHYNISRSTFHKIVTETVFPGYRVGRLEQKERDGERVFLMDTLSDMYPME